MPDPVIEFKGFTGSMPQEPVATAPVEPTPAAEPAPSSEPVTTSVETPIEPVVVASEPAPVAEPVMAQPAPASPSVPEPVQQAPIDPYKELGIAEEHKGTAEKLIAALKNNELENYLRISTADYKNMPPEQIIRMDIQRNNPGISHEDVEFLLEDRMQRQYGITGLDEEADARGKRLMGLDANKVREVFMSEQQNYKIPEITPVPSEPKPDPAIEAQQREFMARIEADPTLNEFERNKTLKMGSGEEAFNYNVDSPIDIRKAWYEPGAIYAPFFNADGTVNMDKMIKAQAYAQNPERIESLLINHGKTIGKKEAYDELRNPADPQAVTAPPTPEEKIKWVGWR